MCPVWCNDVLKAVSVVVYDGEVGGGMVVGVAGAGVGVGSIVGELGVVDGVGGHGVFLFLAVVFSLVSVFYHAQPLCVYMCGRAVLGCVAVGGGAGVRASPAGRLCCLFPAGLSVCAPRVRLFL